MANSPTHNLQLTWLLSRQQKIATLRRLLYGTRSINERRKPREFDLTILTNAEIDRCIAIRRRIDRRQKLAGSDTSFIHAINEKLIAQAPTTPIP